MNSKRFSAFSSGRKKVSFNPKIEVTNVECWKKYNYDISKLTEYNFFKRELMAYKER